MKKVFLGILISALLIYLSLKGADFQDVRTGLARINSGYIWSSLLLMTSMQALRAWRWGLILRPLGQLGAMRVLAITSVGFLAITALPARLGELLRPYLVAKSSDISMSAALGTVFVERFLDGVTVLAIASLTTLFASLPPWLARAGFAFLLLNLALLVVIFCAVFRRPLLEGLIHYFIRRLPVPWSERLGQFFRHFLDGFQIIGDGSRLWRVLLLSCLIWLINGLAIYTLFQAFDSSLPLVAAFVLMIVLVVGIAIPTAPGFIGNWHFSCVLGLGLFGVAKTEALTFAIVYHFLAVGLTVVIGLLFLPYLQFSFADLWKAAKRQGTAAG